MNSFKVTFTDGSNYETSANGTLKEFTAYLMQFGGVVVDENQVTGEETRRYIETVQQVPQVGETYNFKDFDGNTCGLIVTQVTDTHVYYKFSDIREGDSLIYARSYPMILDVWYTNKDKREYIGKTSDPEALEFFV